MLHRQRRAVREMQSAADVGAEQAARTGGPELVEQRLPEGIGASRRRQHLCARGTATAHAFLERARIQFDHFQSRHPRQQRARGDIALHHVALGAGQVQRDAFAGVAEAQAIGAGGEEIDRVDGRAGAIQRLRQRFMAATGECQHRRCPRESGAIGCGQRCSRNLIACVRMQRPAAGLVFGNLDFDAGCCAQTR